MRRIALCLLAATLPLLSFSQKLPLKLKVGDKVGVTVFGVEGYDSEAIVLSDGSINGRGFGRIVVEGKTILEAESLVKKNLGKILRNPSVTVIVLSQQVDVVYLSGVKSPNGGAVPLQPGMDLRQLLASVELTADADQMEARLFRPGQVTQVFNVSDVMGKGKVPVLQPNDVVAVMPVEFIRVWVTGPVAKPGQYRLPAGSDPYMAVAEAGGILSEAMSRSDSELVLQRGNSREVLPIQPGDRKIELQSGDTLIVQLAPRIEASVSGEVKSAGSFTLKAGASLAQALGAAGGMTPDALEPEVLVVRQGSVLRFDGAPNVSKGVLIEDGDVVIVLKNRRTAVAVGAVNRAGSIVLDAKRTYRLSEILAEAGGEAPNASLTRVYLGRAGADGKTVVTEYRLDKFLKDGDSSQNPIVEPGDVVLFGTKKGMSLSEVIPVINSALLIFRVIQK